MPNRLLRTRSLIFSPKKLKDRQIVKKYQDRILGTRTSNGRRKINVQRRRTNGSDET
jgi:hypothetical protein